MRLKIMLVGMVCVLCSYAAQAQPLTFNSDVPADNAATRTNWLAAMGIVTPENTLDFETGFVDGQILDDAALPGHPNLLIRHTATGEDAVIETGNGSISGSNPVGTFGIETSEDAFLELDFSSSPVDYVAFQDIDTGGTAITVVFTDNSTYDFNTETTSGSGDSAEFIGIFRDAEPLISLIRMDASGGGIWGIDTIEYGIVPEPSTYMMLGLLALFGLGYHRYRKKKTAVD